jgi:large subunit ribosomal protein L29
MVRLVTAEKIRELTDEEIVKKVSDYKEELFNLRFQMVTGQVDNPKQLMAIKKNIARCKTVLRQREIAQQVKA